MANWLVLGANDDIEFEMSSAAFCSTCGAKTRHLPELPVRLRRGHLPRSARSVWTTFDGTLVVNLAVLAILNGSGYEIVSHGIDEQWALLDVTAFAPLPDNGRRSVGDACPVCGSHAADLARAPVRIPELHKPVAFSRTEEVFGEGSSRGPLWFASQGAIDLLFASGVDDLLIEELGVGPVVE